MPGCVLRVVGSTQKIKRFLATSSFLPELVYYKGEPRTIKSKEVRKFSGFNLLLSSSDGISRQAHGAVRFMKLHKNEFDRMEAFKFKKAIIDFGLYDLSTNNHPWPTYKIPRSLIILAATYGFEIELSFYGKS